MNYFWIYDIHMIFSFILVVGSITLVSIGGIFMMRPFVKKWWQGHDNNDQIAFYLSAIGVFYGITLGLLAAGIWQNFEDADEKVTIESSAIGALYRDISSFPSPKKDTLQKKLANYTYRTIYVTWPLHQQGIIKTNGTKLLTDFQKELYSFTPQDERENTIFKEALQQFNKVSELRRQRISSVQNGMPTIVWFVIFFGAIIVLVICWLFNLPSLKMHIIFNTLIGLSIGSLIYLILMFDYPFRGKVSITPDAYIEVYEELMVK
jgi:hypothetical protein